VDASCEVGIARAAARDYGIDEERAGALVEDVRRVVAGWRSEADRLAIPRSEQSLMAPAFAA
jgi:serine/threonine-protein kinase HipA